MSKNQLILKHFQKADQLTISNKVYTDSLSSLFKWLISSDEINNDKTTMSLGIEGDQKAKIVSKEKGIAAGLEEVGYLLKKHTSLLFRPRIKDCENIKKGEIIAELEGKVSEVLIYERTILNILQRMSGIATKTNRLIKLLTPKPFTLNPKPYLAATRKTPWMLLDKKAVAIGGGLTHRLSLSDGILIKDNHLNVIKKAYNRDNIKSAIGKAIQLSISKIQNPNFKYQIKSKILNPKTENQECLIEIEVETESEVLSALSAFQPFSHSSHLAILLDNFSPDSAQKKIESLKKQFDLSEIIFEASGGINEGNLKEWANTGVDIISLGSLTHSTKALNISLDF